MVKLNYEANIEALYIFSWLAAKKSIDSASMDENRLSAWLERTWASSFKPNIQIVCKNRDEKGSCKKHGTKCQRHFTCPIILKDLSQVGNK